MTKIKSLDDILNQVTREEELMPEVLVCSYRICESFGKGAIVHFGAEDIEELLGIDGEQIDSTMHVLAEKGLLKIASMGGAKYGCNFRITDHGKEVSRKILLNQIEEMQNIQNQDGRESVFIIHGHDENFKNEVFEFINKLGLKPVILHEVEDRGRTIIEKLEHEVSKAKFAIALWTPDDTMENGDKRVRQNVILETGIFCNNLTRKGVRILIKGKVEIPSDLDGVLRTHVDQEGKWKNELMREIRAAGIVIK